jgi:hypothetical protein
VCNKYVQLLRPSNAARLVDAASEDDLEEYEPLGALVDSICTRNPEAKRSDVEKRCVTLRYGA